MRAARGLCEVCAGVLRLFSLMQSRSRLSRAATAVKDFVFTSESCVSLSEARLADVSVMFDPPHRVNVFQSSEVRSVRATLFPHAEPDPSGVCVGIAGAILGTVHRKTNNYRPPRQTVHKFEKRIDAWRTSWTTCAVLRSNIARCSLQSGSHDGAPVRKAYMSSRCRSAVIGNAGNIAPADEASGLRACEPLRSCDVRCVV